MPDISSASIGSALSDGTGVSSITAIKFAKDFIADALISGAAALATVQIVSLDQAAAQPTVVVFAIGGAIIHAAYRAALKWATS